MKVECKSDSEDIRIYVNGLLHIRIPRDKDIKIQSWIEGHTKTYRIEVWCVGHTDRFVYDNRNMWSQILKLLDKHI